MTKIKGVKNWYCSLEMKAPCRCFLVDVQCGFLVGSGWLLLCPGGRWMVTVISWLVGGPTENTVSIDTESRLDVTHSLHAAHRKPAARV